MTTISKNMIYIRDALKRNASLAARMDIDAWTLDQQGRAERVAIYKNYAAGEHRAQLTERMAKALRINPSALLESFNLNYCDTTVQYMADRLEVTAIEADEDKASEWLTGVLTDVRFDGVQIDVHEAAVRDGDTFVIVEWDNLAQRLTVAHEDAYDGVDGVLALYPTKKATMPEAVIKVWAVTVEEPDQDGTVVATEAARLNVYYADRVEKYVARASAGIERYEVDGEDWPAPWLDDQGNSLGIPVVHFRNRSAPHGRSELRDAVTPQDAINRLFYSGIMAGENTAFGIRVAKGFDPPAELTPGMWLKIARSRTLADGTTQAEPLNTGDVADAYTLDQADPMPYFQMAEWIISRLADITSTPLMGLLGGPDASGEALKQREIGFLGKMRRAHVQFGNAWEDMAATMHRVQSAFAAPPAKPPAAERFYCRWRDAEIRNDKEVVESVKQVADWLDAKTRLRELSGVFGWDDGQIDAIIAAIQDEAAGNVAMLVNALPVPGRENRTA